MTDAEGMGIYQLKRKVDGLYPTLEIVNGTVLIRLLKFLGSLAQELDAVGAS